MKKKVAVPKSQNIKETSIIFQGLGVNYRNTPVFSDFNLSIPIPGITAIVGPSGCGKSTLLKVIAGLHPYIGILHLPFEKSQIGMLFQDDELLPWENVFTNISLGLKFRKAKKEEIDEKVQAWLERIHLNGFEQRYPASLSGGQRKRVAIAQCLILSPSLLLLDEPFSSLDAIVRRSIVDFIFGWIRANKLNAVLVTHDLDEAVSIADQIAVLSANGRIIKKMQVNLPGKKPSERKEAKGFNHYIKDLWWGMEQTINRK